MSDFEKELKDFVKMVSSAQSAYNYCLMKVQEMDNATQDILHQIELGKPKDRNKWATKLHHVRVERRKAKDRIALLEPIVKNVQENHATIKSFERALGDVRKEKGKMVNRTYKPKVILDLDICSENA